MSAFAWALVYVVLAVAVLLGVYALACVYLSRRDRD